MTKNKDALKEELTKFLHDLSYEIKEKARGHYDPIAFRGMVAEKGGLETASYLIRERESEGFTRLYELKLMKLALEAQIIENPKFHSLFTEDELKKCRFRLREYGYKFKT